PSPSGSDESSSPPMPTGVKKPVRIRSYGLAAMKRPESGSRPFAVSVNCAATPRAKPLTRSGDSAVTRSPPRLVALPTRLQQPCCLRPDLALQDPNAALYGRDQRLKALQTKRAATSGRPHALSTDDQYARFGLHRKNHGLLRLAVLSLEREQRRGTLSNH